MLAFLKVFAREARETAFDAHGCKEKGPPRCLQNGPSLGGNRPDGHAKLEARACRLAGMMLRRIKSKCKCLSQCSDHLLAHSTGVLRSQ
jgi:hypothetical protein